MSKLLLTVLVVLVFQGEVKEIELKDYYDGCGIIFSEKHNVVFDIGEKKRFFPTLEQVVIAEEIFKSQLEFVWKDKLKVRKYNRQYIGFVDKSGKKVILIQLLNFSNPRKSQLKFQNWKEEFVVGFGGFYESNTIRFTANIESNQLKLF